MNKPARSLATLFVLVLLCISVRLAGLGQYPQAHPDEGFWACGPRNWVLHGDGLMDGRLHPFLSPATFVLLSGWFALLPPDLVTARAFSVMWGVLTFALVIQIARTHFGKDAWLPVLFFTLSSLAVLIHRLILLEAHQMFWLTLAAACWLSSWRGTALAAGGAFGMALLVKSNSIYLLPAFLLTLPAVSLRPAGLLLLGTLVLAGGGYLAAWLGWPAEFTTAFYYEVEGSRFVDPGVLFHIGRFGLHPARLSRVIADLFVTDALLVLLAALGCGMIIHRWRSASRADRFFVLWLGCGLVFLLGQIYVEHRYLTTLAPPLAFLAARAVVPLFAPHPRSWKLALTIGVILVASFSIFHLARIGRGILRRPNADYWHVVAWMQTSAAPDARVLAAPSFNLSLPQPGYDFFRMLVPYHGQRRSLDAVVSQYQFAYIIDDPQWRTYETPQMRRFLDTKCAIRFRTDEVAIWEVVLRE